MADIPYKKLPGRGNRHQGAIAVSARVCRLYLGPDHLLSVDTFYWNEDYKRFYFADVQAIVCRRTLTGRVINLVLGFLVLLLALLPVLFPNDPVAFYFAVSVGVPLLLIVVVNALLGPTCRVWIKTAVQTEELPSLKRLRNYFKAMIVIEPLLRAAQPVGAAPAAAGQPGIPASPAVEPARPVDLGPTPST